MKKRHNCHYYFLANVNQTIDRKYFSCIENAQGNFDMINTKLYTYNLYLNR